LLFKTKEGLKLAGIATHDEFVTSRPRGDGPSAADVMCTMKVWEPLVDNHLPWIRGVVDLDAGEGGDVQAGRLQKTGQVPALHPSLCLGPKRPGLAINLDAERVEGVVDQLPAQAIFRDREGYFCNDLPGGLVYKFIIDPNLFLADE
jgi:hypothetical protein